MRLQVINFINDLWNGLNFLRKSPSNEKTKFSHKMEKRKRDKKQMSPKWEQKTLSKRKAQWAAKTKSPDGDNPQALRARAKRWQAPKVKRHKANRLSLRAKRPAKACGKQKQTRFAPRVDKIENFVFKKQTRKLCFQSWQNMQS